MLVLQRLISEEIIINGNIRVMLISAHGGKARIGIDAPDGMPVHRAEIQDKVNQQARMRLFNETLHAQQKRHPSGSHSPDVPTQSAEES